MVMDSTIWIEGPLRDNHFQEREAHASQSRDYQASAVNLSQVVSGNINLKESVDVGGGHQGFEFNSGGQMEASGWRRKDL